MSALILKDLYIMKKYCRSVLLMVVNSGARRYSPILGTYSGHFSP